MSLQLVFIFALLLSTLSITFVNSYAASSCYDSLGRAKKCIPDFLNVAYELRDIDVTNTCGLPQTQYCVQSTLHTSKDNKKKCDYCNASNPHKSHPASYLTDFNDPSKLTWWQSDTMAEGIQYPNSVNITFHLNKSYDITFIRINFHSPRPESFAIYKRINPIKDEWIPYQYYSASCQQTYGVPNRQHVLRGYEGFALCTDEFSDISPLTGASVYFSTLEGRPSAYQFDSNDELKQWVSATDIKIVLSRLNTFGDEIFGDRKVLQSYYYAISDISIGARCKCNGHAEKCLELDNGQMSCLCEHFTNGTDCEKCANFYNDLPWKQATDQNPFECQPCNCNGLSDECYFNEDLYQRTGHGGHCINCAGNTAGENCQTCKEGYYKRSGEKYCVDCECNPTGSVSLHCDSSGLCKCKPGVRGDKCDQCEDFYYGLNEDGCKKCSCDARGSKEVPYKCSNIDGQCECKQFVEGIECNRCRFGFYNLDGSNPYGCQACFCFGHSKSCKSARNYFQSNVTTKDLSFDYLHLSNGKKALYTQSDDTFIVKHESPLTNDFLYLELPNEFTGDHRLSYNQDLRFRMRLSKQIPLDLSRFDVVLEGSNSRKISIALSDNERRVRPSTKWELFVFKLNPSANWIPREIQNEFTVLLANVTSIKLRVNYGSADVYLSDVSLGGAKHLYDSNDHMSEVGYVEQCECPIGYAGLSCEQCAFNYTRENPGLGPSSRCVPCSCNGHSLTCDPNDGKCTCLYHTIGDSCDECEDGYYGNALDGTLNDCRKCPCPGDGPCIQVQNLQNPSKLDVVCTQCPLGTEGNLCEQCSDGYYSTGIGKCVPCECSSNVDPNEIGNCDTQTGTCLKCLYNTTGDHCERCVNGYWGNAETSLKCHACECDVDGSLSDQCDLSNGQCSCRPNVISRQCNRCKDGYWNLHSGNGCESCSCNVLGSSSLKCDQFDGSCKCKPGVTGVKCDQCKINYYGLDDDGCKVCNCDPLGSLNQQCDETGRCSCAENFAGVKCNQCVENFFNLSSGCIKCPECYSLVRDGVNKMRLTIRVLQDSLGNLENLYWTLDENKDLESRTHLLRIGVDKLHDELYTHNGLKETFDASVAHLFEQLKLLTMNMISNETLVDQLSKDFITIRQIYDNLSKKFDDLIKLIQMASDDIEDYQAKIDTLVRENEPSEENKKLAELAKKAREKAAENAKIAQVTSDLVADHISQAVILIDSLKDLIDKISQFDSLIDKHHLSMKETESSIKIVDDQLAKARDLLQSQVKLVTEAINKLEETPAKNDEAEENSLSLHISSMNEASKNLKIEIDGLKDQIDSQNHQELEASLTNSQEKFEKARKLNEHLIDLKNQGEKINATNHDAFNTTLQLYEKAQKMLERLENFDQYISRDKVIFMDKISLIPEIQNNLNEAKHILKELKANLNNLNLREIEQFDLKLDVLNDKTKALENQAKQLSQRYEKIQEKYKKFPLSSEIKNLHESFDKRYDVAVNKAENITDRTKSLLNHIDKNLGVLTTLDKTLSNIDFDSLALMDINKFEKEFDRILIRIDETLTNNDIFENVELRNKDLQKRISQAEKQTKLLQAKVDELDKLNRSLNFNNQGSQCFNSGQSNNEVSQQNGNRQRERKNLRGNH